VDARTERDRLRELLDLLLRSLDEDIDGAGIAARGCLSRYHFDRIISSAIGEAPGAFRRRILLERAAWELHGDQATIADVTVAAGYGSVAAFTRSFSRAFGTTPGHYRTTRTSFHLSAQNGIHFHPPGGIAVLASHERSTPMDVVDRIIEHDIWFTDRLLDRARTLPNEALDCPLVDAACWLTAAEHSPTLRSLLHEIVQNKETWVASIRGRSRPPEGSEEIEDLRHRFQVAAREFADCVRTIRDRGEWDAGFVDALCDPPQSFTYGGILAHVATFSAVRRTMAVCALRQLGVADLGIGDPLDWERALVERAWAAQEG
jgi:AraC-like DNA-binding protein/uncharacterized damage-inducible protein DinB